MKIVTSLSFQGQCREAFEFYAEVLGGKITADFFWSPDYDALVHRSWAPCLVNTHAPS